MVLHSICILHLWPYIFKIRIRFPLTHILFFGGAISGFSELFLMVLGDHMVLGIEPGPLYAEHVPNPFRSLLGISSTAFDFYDQHVPSLRE